MEMNLHQVKFVVQWRRQEVNSHIKVVPTGLHEKLDYAFLTGYLTGKECKTEVATCPQGKAIPK